MKTLRSFSITPLATALFLGGTLLAVSACKGHDNATPAADTAATTPSGATTAMPADTATANAGMAGDTTATGSDMSGNSTTSMPSDTSANPDAMANGPIADTDFYQQALTGGQKEIDAAKMEAKQGNSADAKKLANELVADHTALGKKVAAAAGSGVTPPPSDTTPPADLQGKTGADLDKAWADMMVSDHQKTVAMFENAAKNASTDKAKKLASDALPTLRDHLKKSQDLQQKLASK
jgi:putative membrane protein